jgi:hypothetical protein
LQNLNEITSSTHTPPTVQEDSLVARGCEYLLPYLPGNGARKELDGAWLTRELLLLQSPAMAPEKSLMSTNASILADSVGPISAEVYRTTASFP